MMNKHRWRRRRALPALAVTAVVGLASGFAIDSAAASAHTVNVQQVQSENWAGYVAQNNSGQRFSSVSGNWTEPSVSAGSGEGYSAFWVGLGGASQQSQSLEQVGTSADVVTGRTQYYAWYELVPAAETRLKLDIHPGDHISARVTVNGTNVTVSLSDRTTGQSVTKTLHMSDPDTSSAEWIAEAPATTSQNGDNQVLPLADFGKVTFTGASATAGGHTGTIGDSNWTAQEVQLASSNSAGFPGGSIAPSGLGFGEQAALASAAASPSSLSNGGSSFSVSYAAGSSPQASTGTDPNSSAGGYRYPTGGYGYPGGGYLGDGVPNAGTGYPGYGYGGGYTYATPGGYLAGL